jgi:arabinogalactan endo-1,4-beta-galactosidase
MRLSRFVASCLLVLAALPAANLNAQSTQPRTHSTRVQPSAQPPDEPYAFGADVSFLPQAEQSGVVLKDNGVAKPGLQILHDHGYNWIRMRVFVDPAAARTHLPNDLAYSIALAKRAKALGFKVEVGFHYSDTWSDRFHQMPPAAWQTQTHQQLVATVFAYTRDSIAAFAAAGAMPDMVQIGNEPTLGFLWPDGKLPENWDHYADLVRAGIRGMDAGRGKSPRPRILIQLDLGGDWAASKAWWDKFMTYHIPFDVMAQSYYAHDYHSLMELRENLNNTARTYHKDVIVVETSYTWKPSRNFPDHDGPFPETPEGQAAFLDELNRIVMAVPDNHGKGVFYWEPFWPRAGQDRGMVDADGNTLPVIRVYDKWTGGAASRSHTPLATPQLTDPNWKPAPLASPTR